MKGNLSKPIIILFQFFRSNLGDTLWILLMNLLNLLAINESLAIIIYLIWRFALRILQSELFLNFIKLHFIWMLLAELDYLHLKRESIIRVHLVRFIECLVINIFMNNRSAADITLSVFECLISAKYTWISNRIPAYLFCPDWRYWLV
jgi:hypothetical protein